MAARVVRGTKDSWSIGLSIAQDPSRKLSRLRLQMETQSLSMRPPRLVLQDLLKRLVSRLISFVSQKGNCLAVELRGGMSCTSPSSMVHWDRGSISLYACLLDQVRQGSVSDHELSFLSQKPIATSENPMLNPCIDWMPKHIAETNRDQFSDVPS